MAKGVELASAYISLSVSTDGVPKQIEKELGATEKTAEKVGKKIGRKLSDGASDGVSGGNLSKTLARELGSAGDKGSKELLRKLASGHRQAERDAQVAGKNYARAMADAMSGGSKEAAHKYEQEFRRALNARNTSQVFFDEFHRDGVSRGQRVGAAIGKVIGGSIGLALRGATIAATAGLTAVVGGIGFSLFKGFDRYKSLDASAKRLRTLGKDGSEVRTILSDINEVVEGTPIALDAATEAATNFITAGMEGEELKKTLTAIADAAGASQTDFSTLATIFGQVNNKGKLMGEEIQQLAERGLNVLPLLKQQFKDLPEDIGDAGLTIGNLVDVVEKKFGGMAKAAADTVEGSISQMSTALKRVGANFISAIFGDPLSDTEGPGAMANSINKVTEKLNDLNAWVVGNGPTILGFFANMGTAAITMAQVVVGAFTYISRGIGWTVNVFGDILGGMTKALSGLNRLLGRDEIADQLAADAEGMFGWGDALLDAANKSDEAYKSLDKMFWEITDWKGNAQEAAKFTNDLGKAVAEVSEKDVILKAPTQDDLKKIDQAKFKIISIPDSKDVIIRPQTKEAAQEINAFREKEGKKPVVFFTDANMEPASDTTEAWRRLEEKTPATIPVDANTQPAASKMQMFLEQWTKGITIPISVMPGQGAPGQNPLDIFAPGGGSGNGPGFTIGGAPGLPRSGGGNNAPNTGGSLTAATASVQSYLRNELGFKGTIGGWRPPDGYNEHSSGKALDVMISSSAEGYSILPNALTRPGVQYVIWDNKMWYPDGTSKAYTGPNPHTDHLHIKTFATGGAAEANPNWHFFDPEGRGWWHHPGAVEAIFGPDGMPIGTIPYHDKAGGRPGPGDGGLIPGATAPGAGEGLGPPTGDATGMPAPWWPRIGGSIWEWLKRRPRGFNLGGPVRGPGGPTADKIPAWLSDGEHVLTAEDVAAMGGQGGVYAFRNALHRKDGGGAVDPIDWLSDAGVVRRSGNFNPGIKIDTSTSWYDRPIDRTLRGRGTRGMLPPDMVPKDYLNWLKYSGMAAPGFAGGGGAEDEMLKQFIQSGGAKVAAETAARMAPQMNPQMDGPVPVGPDGKPLGSDGAQLPEGLGRTEGYIPAGAGFSGKTGGGLLGGLIGIGGEAAKGAIQVAADLGKMAASAAASAGTFGAGAAAGPAASAGIQIGADIAKRGVDYGVEMANIGIGGLTEILFPFGAPRWLSDVDPTAFMPNLGGSPLATTAAEALKQGMGPGMADPNAPHGQNAGQPPGPAPHQGAGTPPGPVPPGPGIGGAAGQPVQPPKPATPPPDQQGNGFNFIDIIKGGIFDNGGVLAPQSAAFNLSNRPEYVFTDSQWKTMEAHASRGGGMNVTYHVMGKDLDDTLRELKKHERRQSGPMMRGKAGL